MSDLEQLEQTIMGEIAAASDEQAIEAVRVAALGKKALSLKSSRRWAA